MPQIPVSVIKASLGFSEENSDFNNKLRIFKKASVRRATNIGNHAILNNNWPGFISWRWIQSASPNFYSLNASFLENTNIYLIEDISEYCYNLRSNKENVDFNKISVVQGFINSFLEFTRLCNDNFNGNSERWNLGLLSLTGILYSENNNGRNQVVLLDFGWRATNLQDDPNIVWINLDQNVAIASGGDNNQSYSIKKSIARLLSLVLAGGKILDAQNANLFRNTNAHNDWVRLVNAQVNDDPDIFTYKINLKDLFNIQSKNVPSEIKTISGTTKIEIINKPKKTSISIWILSIFISILFGIAIWLVIDPSVVEKVKNKVFNDSNVAAKQLIELKDIFSTTEKDLNGNYFEKMDAIKKIKKALIDFPLAEKAENGSEYVEWVKRAIAE